ncbi:hypothetical protein AXG93_815s1240 [Marchantia polymorpha subsp. ruderalis]|uniref:Uncharacterized protein n=1 Tax=Marchantia polymorpha subsp. ruderalis TaxID=1480154 RepID=A0A176W200_MARPO|nr:hypothetical protein AXG93_815s1240 [Marchantia polymorpha subsp. ruderalis]
MAKELQTSAVSPTPLVSRRATRKEKGKVIMMEEVTPGRNQVASTSIRMRVPLEKPTKVLKVSLDTEVDLEKVADRIVEDVVGETAAPQKVVSPRMSTRTVTLETGEDHLAEEIQSQVLNAADVLCGCATVDLRDRLEASRTAFNAESQRVDELTATLERKEQKHAAKLAAKTKDLAECEAAKIADQEFIEKLDAQCNELRSQSSQAEEQLWEMEVETQKWLQLRDLERRATAMIACSVSG